MNSHKKTTNRILLIVLVALIISYSLAPFLWQVLTSIKPEKEVISIPPTYLPTKVSFENYKKVFMEKPFGWWIFNSVLVAMGATLLALAAGAPAAYALARLRLRGTGVILKLILVGALFPQIVYLLPLFEMVSALGLMNNPLALIIPYAALNVPFVVWILYSFFRQVPGDLEDAALVDGFSRTGILVKIILPVSAPALATTAILVFIFAWNEFLFAFAFMSRKLAYTVPVGIATLSGGSPYVIPWGQIAAAIVITTMPVVIIILALQRRIVQGLTAGSVKG
ncbi:MAG: carbohydrate ABC transporter permease [Planctomycetota bacterium]|nr:MAG: carbohydrate ABC transporter permease [Planctomycetota bacterium]